MSKFIRTVVVAFAGISALGGVFAAGPCCACAAELSAGVARVDLTPPLELKSPLGGYGERMNRPAEGVHDRIFAKALVLSDGDEEVRGGDGRHRRLSATGETRCSPSGSLIAAGRRRQILLLPSHSHTSIEMNAINPANTFDVPQIGIYNPRVFDFVMDRLVQVVRDAERELVPVSVGTSSMRDRRLEPQSPQRRRDRQGAHRHAHRHGPGQAAGGAGQLHRPSDVHVGQDMLFSGDWPGHLQRTLESLIGEGVTAMYYNGAEGDQAPVGRPDAGEAAGNGPNVTAATWGSSPGNSGRRRRRNVDVAFAYHHTRSRSPSEPGIPTS